MQQVRVGVFPGTFNPPTIAHLALIESARRQVDRVVAVIPRTLPHKQWHGASFEDRIAMLEAARAGSDYEVRVTEGGLFIDIAREFRPIYGPDAELWFICGRDAAQRIVEWDYGYPGAIHRMLDEFGLLVAARQGDYEPPAELAHRVRQLPVPTEVDQLSATDIRSRIECGKPWEHLVPGPAVELISRAYGPHPSQSR
jgi:nicotinate-nucleotide adenylyltransferase